jgi:hypothetical protein
MIATENRGVWRAHGWRLLHHTKSTSRRRSAILSITKRRVITVIAAIVYPVLLLWVLRDLLAPSWGYMGFNYLPPESLLFAVTTVLFAVVPALWMPLTGVRPGSVIVWIMYLLAYVPSQIMPVFSSGKVFRDFFDHQLSLLSGVIILAVMSAFPVVRLPRPKVSATVFWAGVAALSLASYALIVAEFGLPTQLPGIYDVYNVRSDFEELTVTANPIIGMLMNWQQKVVNPLLIAYGVVRRKPIALAGGLIGQLLLYSFAGHKTVLFSAFMVFGILIGLWKGARYFAPVIVVGLISLVTLLATMDIAANSLALTSLFVRRMILLPGLLTGHYFEYFSTHEMAHSLGPLLTPFFENPYGISLPRVIGGEYFGSDSVAANANMWADAFANFGVVGIVTFSVILGVIIWIFNSLALERDYRLVGSLAGLSAWTLCNSGLGVSLLTHGIAFALVIVYFMPHMAQDRDGDSSATPELERSGRGNKRRAPATFGERR